MRFPCHPVDASFFDTAPMRFRNTVELAARPADVFAIFEDGESWPRWFHGIHKVVWTSDKPYGVGTTRTVWLTGVTVQERFFRWEQDRRFSFYLTGHSMPLAHALAEDYLLDEVAAGKTRFTYSVAIEPRLALRLGGPITQTYFGSRFWNGCKGLQSYVLKATGPRRAPERRHEGGWLVEDHAHALPTDGRVKMKRHSKLTAVVAATIMAAEKFRTN